MYQIDPTTRKDANQHLSTNVTSDQNNYSAPVPIIGLYIAGATMVCFLLILCDVISGFRRRKEWLPCRFFPLNSVTLTLLSIASKLPVDLTTPMLSVQDQLSKLTGTAIICVSMCFFMPSVGANSATESVNNMFALSILVITVIVYICIQMSTGVIFSFIPEHVIIMLFMLVALLNLWLSTFDVIDDKKTLSDLNKQIFTMGKGNMLQRLKVCLVHGCDSSPQYDSCDPSFSPTHFFGFISIGSFIVVIQVILRSVHELGVSSGLSDYGWSIWIILVTQILAILLGTLATVFRWVINVFKRPATEMKGLGKSLMNKENTIRLAERVPFVKASDATLLAYFICLLFIIGYFAIALPLLLPVMIAMTIINFIAVSIDCCSICVIHHHCDRQPEAIEQYKLLLHERGIKWKEWTLEKCMEDMKRWESVNENDPPSHLVQLLSKTAPSQPSLQQLKSQFDLEKENEVSCLYLVFLARIASMITPSALRTNLVLSLHEVFHIVLFVDSKLNSSRLNRRKCTFARFMWRMHFSFASLEALKVSLTEASQVQIDSSGAISKEAAQAIAPAFMRKEVDVVLDLINGQECVSHEELHASVEQLYVDMLHIFLIQLPEVIFREVTESSVEDYEDKVRLMLKFVLWIRPLEDKVQWSFPIGSNITGLTTDQISTATHDHDSTQASDNVSDVTAPHVVGHVDRNVCSAQLDEIIQVDE